MAFFTRRPENEDNDYTLFLLEEEQQPQEPEAAAESENEPLMFFEEEPQAQPAVVAPAEADWHSTIDSFAEPTEAEEDGVEADKPENGKPQHAAPAKRTFRELLVDIFVPMRGDDVISIVRKAVAILCVIGILVSLGWLFNDLWLVPVKNEKLSEDLARLYDPEVDKEFSAEVEEFDQYPEGMDPAFRALYYSNPDIRGWITYTSSSKEWYGINYPVVQASDNDKYLYRDFYGSKNKNGTLFFDSRNSITPQGNDQSTIIYGHNMLSGQMFASLNKLLMNVGMARSAPTLSMNTIYHQADYKVFAVFIWDNENPGGFNYMRNSFSSATDFMQYIEEIRMRSWYDYNDVDVQPNDELLVLSTCSNTSQTHLSDGRTVVVARKVRPDESSAVNVNKIVNNEDVLQPIAWYKAEKLPLPDYYANQQGAQSTTGSTSSTTKPSGNKDPNVLSLNLQHDEGVAGYSVTVNGKPYDPYLNPIKKSATVEITLILNDGYQVVSWNGQSGNKTVYTLSDVQADIQLVVDTTGSSTDKTSAQTTTPTGKPSTSTSTTTSTSGDTTDTTASGDTTGSTEESGDTTSSTESTGSTEESGDTTTSTESTTESTTTTTEAESGPTENGGDEVTE